MDASSLAGRDPAVDEDDLARHVAAGRSSQGNDLADDFQRVADAAEGIALKNEVPEPVSLEMVPYPLRADEGRRHAIDGDVVRSQFHGVLLDQHRKPALGRAVGGISPAPQRELRAHRQKVDLPSSPTLDRKSTRLNSSHVKN